jgi:hypothetical protein
MLAGLNPPVEVFFEKKNFDTAESAMFQVFRHCNETFGV